MLRITLDQMTEAISKASLRLHRRVGIGDDLGRFTVALRRLKALFSLGLGLPFDQVTEPL